MSHIVIDGARTQGQISPYLYGQFAEHLGRCVYGGLWVGTKSEIPNTNGLRNDVVAALRELHVPVLRWPGGCFADTYHWEAGIGPRDQRQRIVNTNWGGVVENNHFGTHEYFELLRQLNAEAYVNGNVGSGSVQEMAAWVEYMTFAGESPQADRRRANGHPDPWPLKFFGVGNESWGCGGNMRPEYYADLYRRYQTFVANSAADQPVYKIASGPNVDDYHWTETLMQRAAPLMDGLSLHHYALAAAWENKRPALGFPESEWYSLLHSAQRMDELITKHSTIMDRYDPDQRIGLIVDEWGSWLAVEPGTNPGFLFQQNTIRDAMVAAVTLHIFQHHAKRVKMANIAQVANVLQAMVLTEGNQMVKTPTYYVFKMLIPHKKATALATLDTLSDTTSASVSHSEAGYFASLCNFSADAADEVKLDFSRPITTVSGERLMGQQMDAHNDFDHPDTVQPQPLTSMQIQEGSLSLCLPPMSLTTVKVLCDE
ncbi:alpha-N-arabinofuranosidase [Lacticaseibacillus baoqingensis]|uniref:non-reducing end alpha-L-arabinofuranosidase n=1 Tax=Lacticaseibacillus baoqingensis TaxID=2486013 RepID=A0ABW4ECA9_9LACO|nr:alpha-L-arabinofuranosidase C-terminal domain-containing protein [Lacticaseibacillus baoqingensis]